MLGILRQIMRLHAVSDLAVGNIVLVVVLGLAFAATGSELPFQNIQANEPNEEQRDRNRNHPGNTTAEHAIEREAEANNTTDKG